jgi:hypothetical protein
VTSIQLGWQEILNPKPKVDSTKADSTKKDSAKVATPAPTPANVPRPPVPTGRGGGQDREWYRGIPIGPKDSALYTRRANTNYMQTGVISALQLAATFPQQVLENFYTRTRNAIEDGKTKPPYGYVIPVQRDMTRAAELVNILRTQRIEIGIATKPVKVGDSTYPAGSYVIKRDQPYGRLAKNLLEKQNYPDARLTTYDDSGWTMGLALNVRVIEVADSSILAVPTNLVDKAVATGTVTGTGTAGIAIAHLGSNNMISLRYKLKGRGHADRREELYGGRRGVSCGFLCDSGDVTFCGDPFGGRVTRAHRGRAQGAAVGAEARRRHSAHRDLLVVGRDAEPGLVPAHVRCVRHSVRPDLQGAGGRGRAQEQV